VAIERVIALEGCLNFRDLGGYPTEAGRTVRWRHVYRSDALHLLTAADVARVRDELGVQTVIDLRSTAELESDGRGRLAGESLGFLHLPLFDGVVTAEAPARAMTLADRYVLLAAQARARIARIVTTLAEADGAVVYHCAAGKDRTGVVSAVVLGLLGVRDEIIVADYAASQANLDAIIERLLAAEGYQAMLEALPPDTLHAAPETMVEFLARMRERFGSMAGYMRAAGVADAVLERLAARLLEG
jgi:protein tyrosine/serine phosphatase